MEGIGDATKGKFVWKIDNFLEWEGTLKTSSAFKLGKSDCFLDIGKIANDGAGNGYIVYIYESISKSINYNISFKLCLINGFGEEFLVTKRTIFKFRGHHFPLLTFWHYDLFHEENNLLPRGVLTLRLSWCNAEGRVCKQDTQAASGLNSEEEPSNLLQKLSKDFLHLYESQKDADFFLRAGEIKIAVHRTVLSARSKIFANMFQDISKDRSDFLDIPDVDAIVLNDVLYYVYSGQIRGMSAHTVIPMYGVANKYALIELRDACLDVLMRSLTIGNVCDAALLAHTHRETQLEEKVLQFVSENVVEIQETYKWKEFLKSQSTLAAKLLRSTYKDEVMNLSLN